MIHHLLLWAFVGLMADRMFGWELNLAPGLSLKNALLYSILLVIGMQAARRRQRVLIDLPHIHLFFGLFILIALLSWTANVLVGMYFDYPTLTRLMLWKGSLLDHYLFFLLFFLGVRSEQEFLWLQKWLLFFVVMASIATVLDAYDMPDLGFIETRGDGRVQGPLGQANSYGMFNAFFLPMLVARALNERGGWRRFFSVGALFTFWALLLTVSRGSMLALLLGSLFSVLFLHQHLNAVQVKRVIGFGLVALICVALLLGRDYVDLILERTVGAADTGDAFEMTSGRTWIWSRALGMMVSEPWTIFTGFGWGTSGQALGIAMHNAYLEHFFELGIFGLLAFVGLLLSILYWTKRAIDSSPPGNPLSPQVIAFFFGFAALSIGIASGTLYSPFYFIWAYTGLAMRAAAILLVSAQDSPVQSSGIGPARAGDASHLTARSRAEAS